ncbi:MAG TPA: HAD-IC family P-type ATPase [Anaerolineae bacterium]|nr:HAD-IC family P-type ATPase [Anaerolineae bacterium]
MSERAPAGRRLLWLSLVIALASALLGLVRAHSLWRRRQKKLEPARLAPDLTQFQGLSEEQALANHSSQLDEERALAARQVRRDIWRSSAFSIFNLGLVGLAAAQALLGDPLSALLTVGILIFNIIISAAQQLYATNRVETILDQTRPIATAIRDGRIQSIELDDVVVGDTLVAGPGDQFLADGELLDGRPQVLEATTAGGLANPQRPVVGSSVREGSFCLRGQAIYRVGALPAFQGGQNWTPVQQKSELTYLQRIMARVLRLMLLLIAIFLGLLVLDMNDWPILGHVFEDLYREAASVFFSIAPSGLYFMIVATYALGSARLGQAGALIRDSRAVESLAQISVLCVGKTGTLTGAGVQVEMLDWAGEIPAVPESRVRRILGDLAHSFRSDNIYLQAIRDHFPGSSRRLAESARFLSIYGWLAITFAEADARGTYVIGLPAVLEPHLAPPPEESTLVAAGDDEEPESPTVTERTAATLRQIGGFFQQARRRAGDLLQRASDAGTEDESAADSGPRLLFAYTPDPSPLVDAGGAQLLPNNLIPLCHLRFVERIRAETREAVGAFTTAGVQVKIVSADSPEKVFSAAEQAGLVEMTGPVISDASPATAVDGPQLSQMDRRSFEQAAEKAIVFGHLTSQQKAEVIEALRRQKERVAMVGDSADDVPAMEKANLNLTLQGSSQASLSLADIVLLEDSFEVLPTVLRQGQFIVNGMLDILKINLAQVSYVTLLIVVMFLSNTRIFYYHPTQGGVIAFFTVIVPSLGLTFFASSGRLPAQYMRTRMAHFVVPAAVTMTLAALLISWLFRRNIDDIPYSELAVTHGLILMGLLLIVFVQPPTRFFVGGDVLSGDWRSTYMAVVLLIVFLLATYLPLTQELLRLAPLDSARDYLIILGIAIAWALILRTIWRLPGLNRYVGIVSHRLERP